MRFPISNTLETLNSDKINQQYYIYNRNNNYDKNNHLIKLTDDFNRIKIAKDKTRLADAIRDITDLQLINKFLQNIDAVKSQLKKLNGILTQRAKEKGQFNEHTQQLIGYLPERPYKHHKLLSSYLYDWAKHNGFNESIKLDSFMPREKFMSVLQQGSLFKDKPLGGDFHGEWTHFIQWWCIVEAYDNGKGKLKLNNSPTTLLRLMGNLDPVIWGSLFEIPPDSPTTIEMGKLKSGIDFRDVLYTNNYLLSDEAKTEIPVLHQLIKGRAIKREEENRLKKSLGFVK